MGSTKKGPTTRYTVESTATAGIIKFTLKERVMLRSTASLNTNYLEIHIFGEFFKSPSLSECVKVDIGCEK